MIESDKTITDVLNNQSIENTKKWRRQIQTDFEDLPTNEQEQYRKQAEALLNLLMNEV